MNKRFFVRSSVIVIALFFVISSFYSLPYYVSKPGMAKELAPIIEVENGYKSEDGSFMLTTVRMGRANIYSYAIAYFNKYQELFTLESIRQEGETDAEYNVRQLYLMSSSKLNAVEVAYKKAGIPIEYEYKGVFVLNVVDGMPAAEKLEPGDRIYRVDDIEFTSSDQFIQYVGGKKAGDEITLTYERNKKIAEVVLAVQPFVDDETRVGVGIGLVEDKEIIVNPTVHIETSDIGGPSAGFMFSLEIYNQLIKEDLTKGYEIAGTGTIASNGKIGRIGGIDQKVVAADKAGADIFFAPFEEGASDSNYEIALETAKDIKTKMKIVPVDTFDEAISYLENMDPKE